MPQALHARACGRDESRFGNRQTSRCKNNQQPDRIPQCCITRRDPTPFRNRSATGPRNPRRRPTGAYGSSLLKCDDSYVIRMRSLALDQPVWERRSMRKDSNEAGATPQCRARTRRSEKVECLSLLSYISPSERGNCLEEQGNDCSMFKERGYSLRI